MAAVASMQTINRARLRSHTASRFRQNSEGSSARLWPGDFTNPPSHWRAHHALFCDHAMRSSWDYARCLVPANVCAGRGPYPESPKACLWCQGVVHRPGAQFYERHGVTALL